MTKVTLLTVLCVLFLVSISFSLEPGDTLWTRTYGGPNDEAASCIQQTLDGGYIISGNTGLGLDKDVYLVKTDPAGDLIWSRVYGQDSQGTEHGGNCVRQTTDGGYIVGSMVGTWGCYDAYLLKTDEYGDSVWARYYDWGGFDGTYWVEQTDDGGYIVAGGADRHILVMKTDQWGNILWTEIRSRTIEDYATCVKLTPDGGYIVAGFTGDSRSRDLFVMKTDGDGNATDILIHDASMHDEGRSVDLTPDGGYIIGGNVQNPDYSHDIRLTKLDADLSVQWERSYGAGSDENGGFARYTPSDGGYILTGRTTSFGAGSRDVYVVKTDANGDTLWTRTFGGTAKDEGYRLDVTRDGGYVIAGYTRSFGAGGSDAYVIRIAAIQQANVSGTVSCEGVGFSGVAVNLLDGGGGLYSSRVTGEGGSYAFEEVPNGSYTVSIAIPAGYACDAPEVGIEVLGQDVICNFTLTRMVANLFGTVSCDGVGMAGVSATLYYSSGEPYGPPTVTNESGYYLFENIPTGDYTVSIVTPAGYTADSESKDVTMLGEPFTCDFLLTRMVAELSGTVTANGNSLCGVTVDLLDATGLIYADTFTNESGYYVFEEVPTGRYVVSVVTPLGYRCEVPEVGVEMVGEDVTQDFNLTSIDITYEQRSKGFWKHQVNVYCSGRGHAQIPEADFIGYLHDIYTHFAENPINSVELYTVSPDASENAKLEAAASLLCFKGNVPMVDRAKQHLMALLLNVVSEKLPQFVPISEDEATASQAITYCWDLIADGEEANDELAKDIADEINNNITVATGVIPLDIPNISYKGSVAADIRVPVSYELSQNYPNPFNTKTVIEYQLPEASDVTLEVYNLLGEKVTTLVDGEQEAGYKSVNWDASAVSSGLYFYKLTAGDYTETRRMVLVK